MTLKNFNNVTDSLQFSLEEWAQDHFETERQFKHRCPLFNSFSMLSSFAYLNESFNEISQICPVQIFDHAVSKPADIKLSYFEKVIKKTFLKRSHKDSDCSFNKMGKRRQERERNVLLPTVDNFDQIVDGFHSFELKQMFGNLLLVIFFMILVGRQTKILPH